MKIVFFLSGIILFIPSGLLSINKINISVNFFPSNIEPGQYQTSIFIAESTNSVNILNTTISISNASFFTNICISLNESIKNFLLYSNSVFILTRVNSLHTFSNEIHSIYKSIGTYSSEDTLPIGSIISIHPFANKPNITNWQKCDGAPVAANSRLKKYLAVTPKLDEDVLLMGSLIVSLIPSGSRYLPPHRHDTSLFVEDALPHEHQQRGVSSGGGSSGLAADGGTHMSPNGDFPSPYTSSDGAHSHSIDPGSYVGIKNRQAPESTLNYPSSFRVIFYIKIN